eukprot:TRINITY_DN75444_c0_g1_i1.p1 TRINITY_DN75444_c0_g1~~TRINITY_DN75444_c0_g1_i1.p1  ORF type:complete len:359 (+),score=42.80 TRINITY_DN75444_c0_g1_i1:30-1106(+)
MKLPRSQLQFVLLSHALTFASTETAGNPVCWKGDFSFDACCKDKRPTDESVCWNGYYNYDLCCFSPYTPSKQCLQHVLAPAQMLFHCRVRPHREFARCFSALPPGLAEKKENIGSLGKFHFSYADYKEAQWRKTAKDIDMRFTSERVLEVVARYINHHFRSGLNQSVVRGLCHGAKTGTEVRSLRRFLRDGHAQQEDTEVLGTDISPEAAAASQGDVIERDFHLVDASWSSAWDFIYSNTLDHAYDPVAALMIWRWCLRSSEGLLILHRSSFHTTMHVDAVDVYGASVGDTCTLLRLAGFEIVDVLRTPEYDHEHGRDREQDLIFAIRGDAPVSKLRGFASNSEAYDVSAMQDNSNRL